MFQEIRIQGVSLEGLFSKFEQLIDAKIGVLPTKSKSNSELLTRNEVLELLKVSAPTLRDWTKQGWLKSYQMGSRVFYKEIEVQEALDKVLSYKHKKIGGYNHAN